MSKTQFDFIAQDYVWFVAAFDNWIPNITASFAGTPDAWAHLQLLFRIFACHVGPVSHECSRLCVFKLRIVNNLRSCFLQMSIGFRVRGLGFAISGFAVRAKIGFPAFETFVRGHLLPT